VQVGGGRHHRVDAVLGLDAEVEARISSDVVRRVSGPGELEQAPFAGALWVAKEASFIALDDDRDLIFSQIRVENWQVAGSVWLFEASFGKECAQGLVVRNDPWLFALTTTA